MLPQCCIVEEADSLCPQTTAKDDESDERQTKRQLADEFSSEQRLLIVRQKTFDRLQENLFHVKDRLRDLVVIQDDHLPPLEQLIRRVAYNTLTGLYIVDCPVELPPDDCFAFGELSLKSLVLSHTQLRRLPCSVFQIDSLEVLKIDGNCLEEIPAQLGNLRRLKTLSCDRQRPKLRALPASIRRLGRLQVLSFSANRIEDVAWMSSLTQLRVVKCDRNRLTSLPRDLVNLHDLASLDISHNRIEFIQPCLVELISRLYRFSYFNLPLRPRYVRHDRQMLLSHLELENLLTNQAASTRPTALDVTVGVVGESCSGKATLVGALSSDRGVCRQEHRKHGAPFDVHQFEISTDEQSGCSGGCVGKCHVNAIVMSCDVLDNFTRNVRVDVYILVVDLSSMEMHRGSHHLSLRQLSRLQMWLKALYEISPATPVLIVGTHADLVKTVALMDIWNTVDGLLNQARHHHARRYAAASAAAAQCPHCLLCAPKEHVVRHAFIKSRSTSGGFVDISVWQTSDQRNVNNHVMPSSSSSSRSTDGECELGDRFKFPHVVGFYEVDSRKSFPKDAKKVNISIEHLKGAILRLGRFLNRVEIPANWLTFVSHLSTLREKAPNLTCIPTEDAVAMARSFDISPSQVMHMLRYFHRRGRVIFFENDAFLSKIVFLSAPLFVQMLRHILGTFGGSVVHISDILSSASDREVERQLQKANRQKVQDGNEVGNWFLAAMQRLEVCVPLLQGQRESRFFLFPSLLEAGSPSQEIWPDIPDWDEKQVTCDVLLRSLKPGFFVDLIVKINGEGRKYLQVLTEPVPIYLSHHIVFFTCIDSGGCEDCGRLRKRIRCSRRTTDEQTTATATTTATEQDDVIHKIHIMLHPRLCSLGIQVRGISPCCTLKAVLVFLELFLDDFPEEEGISNEGGGGGGGCSGSEVTTCSSYDNGVSSSHWKSSGGSPVVCNSNGKGALLGSSVPSLDEDDDREMYLLCPKCVLLRQMHPERISYPCPSSRRRAICSKWHNLGSWTRVVTGDYRFTSLDPTAAINLGALPEHEHPRLVLVLPPSTALSTIDWYLFSRMRFLEGIEIHFLCEYTGYWHFTDDAGYRLNQTFSRFPKRPTANQLTPLFQLAIPLIQCIQGVNDSSQSSRLVAPVIADLIPVYEYLSKQDVPLQVDPCAWLTKHRERVVNMLVKVLSSASDGLPDVYAKTSTAIGADLVFQAASPSSRSAIARLLRLDCSSGKFGSLRPVYVGRDIRWVCEGHYEELRTMPAK